MYKESSSSSEMLPRELSYRTEWRRCFGLSLYLKITALVISWIEIMDTQFILFIIHSNSHYDSQYSQQALVHHPYIYLFLIYRVGDSQLLVKSPLNRIDSIQDIVDSKPNRSTPSKFTKNLGTNLNFNRVLRNRIHHSAGNDKTAK